MKIEAALKKLLYGYKIRRKIWPTRTHLMLSHDARDIMEVTTVGQIQPYIMSLSNMLAEDWEEVEETTYISCDNDSSYKHIVYFLQSSNNLLWCCRGMCATKMTARQIEDKAKIIGYQILSEEGLESLGRLAFDLQAMIDEQKKKDSLSLGSK